MFGTMRQLCSGLARTHLYRLPCSSLLSTRGLRHSAASFSRCQPCCTMCRRQSASHRPCCSRRRHWTPCKGSSMATDAATVLEPEKEHGAQQLNIVEVLRSRGLVQVSRSTFADTFQLAGPCAPNFQVTQQSDCNYIAGHHQPIIGEGGCHGEFDGVLRVRPHSREPALGQLAGHHRAHLVPALRPPASGSAGGCNWPCGGSLRCSTFPN